MKEERKEIRYDGILVGWRQYINGGFVGYTWDELAYRHYEMFIAKRKLC